MMNRARLLVRKLSARLPCDPSNSRLCQCRGHLEEDIALSAAFISFVLFLSSLGLLIWKPQSAAASGSRMLVWAVFGFFVVIDVLFSLFTVWWPPTQTWSVVWSVAAAICLLIVLVSNTKATDWLA
jgi:hypothetical protein